MKKTILVIEDDKAQQDIYQTVFADAGYEVIIESDGRNGFSTMASKHPDIIVSDVRMKNGDGLELLERVSRLQEKLPVIIFATGYRDLEIEDFLDKGAEAIFQKPIDYDLLLVCIGNALLPPEKIWSEKRMATRILVNSYIDLCLDGAPLEEKTILVNFGRRGMFLALKSNFPIVGSYVKFSFSIMEKDDAVTFEGIGVVAWVRGHEISGGATGFGLRFVELNLEAQKFLLREINRNKTTSTIPKYARC